MSKYQVKAGCYGAWQEVPGESRSLNKSLDVLFSIEETWVVKLCQPEGEPIWYMRAETCWSASLDRPDEDLSQVPAGASCGELLVAREE